MGSAAVPDFEEFVRPLVGDFSSRPGIDHVPLSSLPAGDYAVLTWLDDVLSRLPAGVEADITAYWDSMTLRDVYGFLTAGSPAGEASA